MCPLLSLKAIRKVLTMKRTSIYAGLFACALALAAFSAVEQARAATASLSSYKPGTKEVGSFNVGKPLYVEVFNASPTVATTTLSRVSGDYTNTIVSFITAAGVYAGPVTSTNYLLRGDSVLWSGSTTSGTVRVILDAD